MKFTEEELKKYAAPLSETENQKCLNAIKMVRDALKNFGFLADEELISKMYEDTYAYEIRMRNTKGKKVHIFIQGSYANNTNVRTESDVDIAIIEEDVFNTEYRPETSPFPQSDKDYNFIPTQNEDKSFKDKIQECLEDKFGHDVERKNKSIRVHGNTYRKDIDTVPCRRYRDYRNDYRKDVDNYIRGIVITPDIGPRIINYPEQHIANGRRKNNDTNRCYKKMVRIIKKMRNIMSDYGYDEADKVSSFGLESLLWNIPNSEFTKYSIYRFEFGELVEYLYRNKDNFNTYKEANGIKMLCQSPQEALRYKNFVNCLYSFYQYDL